MLDLTYLKVPVNVFVSNTNPLNGKKYPSVNSYHAQSIPFGSLSRFIGTEEAHTARIQKDINLDSYRRAKIFCPCVQISSNAFPRKDLPRSNLQALQSFSGFVCVDIDHYSGSIDRWLDLSGLVAYGKSVSGEGYFFIFRTEYKFINVNQFSDWMRSEVLPLFDGWADPACQDIQRLRFLGIDPIIYTHKTSLIDWITNPPKQGYESQKIKDLKRLDQWSYRQKQLANLATIEDPNLRHTTSFTHFLWIAEDVKKGLYTLTKTQLLDACQVIWNEPLNQYEQDSLLNAFIKVGVDL